ncbi:MAG: hypothetical protein ABEH81_01530 [Halopenitus sp.]
MAHNFYAEIEAEYNGREGQDDYPYARPPTHGVKHIRDSKYLPDYLRTAVWEEFSPEQARMYAECLNDELTGLWPQRENDRIQQIQRTANWLKYWSEQDVDIRGAP